MYHKGPTVLLWCASKALAVVGGYQDSNQRPFTSPFLADYQSVDGSLADNRAVPDSSSPITHSTPAPPYPLQQTAPLLSVPPPPTPRPETPSAAGIGASASVSTATAPAVAETGAQGQLPSEAENSAPALTADGERQTKGHRRGRSLTGLIPTLKTKPKRSQSQALEVIFFLPHGLKDDTLNALRFVMFSKTCCRRAP